LTISNTTVFRAAAFKPDYLPSIVGTHTYLFLNQVIQQSNNPPGLPATWIDTQNRIWTADYEMDPEITGDPQYSGLMKDALRYLVFPDSPVEVFDTLTIRADFNNSWMHWDGAQRLRGQRVRDAFVKDCQRDMSGLSSHSRFFHLYLNGLYWGIYDPTERPDAG